MESNNTIENAACETLIKAIDNLRSVERKPGHSLNFNKLSKNRNMVKELEQERKRKEIWVNHKQLIRMLKFFFKNVDVKIKADTNNLSEQLEEIE